MIMIKIDFDECAPTFLLNKERYYLACGSRILCNKYGWLPAPMMISMINMKMTMMIFIIIIIIIMIVIIANFPMIWVGGIKTR